jgi:1-hydroxycarotenoid 3,4-desaturase
LVSALLLAARGLKVQLLEAADAPGGKIRQVAFGASGIDSGPTVLTMRWIFEQIFSQVGAKLDEHLELTPLEVLARHAWGPDPRRDRLDLYADRARSAEAIGEFSGPREAQRFERFCEEARKVYLALEGPYIRSPRPTLGGMAANLGAGGIARLTGLGPFSTLASLLERRFEDPRLRQLFGRYATYCGASPWLAPATLMLVAQVEMDGVWSLRGGMQALPRALAALAVKLGVEIHTATPVKEICTQGGRACGVRSSDGRFWPADAVVFNGDADALAQGLLGPSARVAVNPRPKSERSLSAFTCSFKARSEGFPLVRHNVFFQDDYPGEFQDVFQRGRLPRQGTVYLCAQDREDAAVEFPQTERLFMLVNAPPNGDLKAADSLEIEQCEQNSLALLSRCGLKLEREPGAWVRTTPQDFSRLFPGSGGGLYGTATHGWMTLFKRSGAQSKLPGLFLAGGSVHPGPGVPMAAMSGVLAAEALMAHLDSTSLSRRVATSGGTSTPSATTAATG